MCTSEGALCLTHCPEEIQRPGQEGHTVSQWSSMAQKSQLPVERIPAASGMERVRVGAVSPQSTTVASLLAPCLASPLAPVSQSSTAYHHDRSLKQTLPVVPEHTGKTMVHVGWKRMKKEQQRNPAAKPLPCADCFPGVKYSFCVREAEGVARSP